MRPRLLIALLCCSAALAAGEALPKPDVPDPFGLGERLALIDWLKTNTASRPAAGATMDELVALYWQARGGAPEKVGEDQQTADRVRRLRAELKDRYKIEPPADVDEVELGRLLSEARTAATAAAVRAVHEKENRRENPRTPEEAAAYAAEDREAIRIRMQRMAEDQRRDREEISQLERKRGDLANNYVARVNRLKGEVAGIERLRGIHQQAVNDYNRKASEVSVPTELEPIRQRVEEAAQALGSAVNDYNRELADLKAVEAEGAAIELRQKRLNEHIAELDRRLAEANQQLASIRDTPAGPATPAGPLAGAEQRLTGAVVLIAVRNRGTGTGFFVTADGLLLTNAHVVGDGKSEMLALWDASAKRPPARLRAIQVLPADDLALLRVEEAGVFAALPIKEVYDLQVPVMAVGFPLAGAIADALNTSPSDIAISKGIISAVRRNGERVDWLQHDCKIASGNSGGPLIETASGAVVGINTMVMSAAKAGGGGDSLPFAIPIRKALDRFAGFLKK